jgi:type IV fimbrial biogenesis protein FimT
MAVPAFHDWLGAYPLANHAKHLAETMTRARTEAVRRGHRVNLCKSVDRRRCADHGGWDAGFVVFVDVNRNGRIDANEPVLEAEGAAPPGISVSGNRPVEDYISYTGLGQSRVLNGALQVGTFVVCRSGQRALHLVLANTRSRARRKDVGSLRLKVPSLDTEGDSRHDDRLDGSALGTHAIVIAMGGRLTTGANWVALRPSVLM